MPEPTARTALRDQIIERAAEWAYAYPISSNAICQTDDRAWRLARIWGEQIARIAVMPVVEAALTRARASCCEDGDRTYAEMERHLTQRAEEAEATVRRMQQLIESYPPGSRFARSGAQALFRATLNTEPPARD